MRTLGLFLLLVGTVNAQTWTATPSYVNNQFTSTNTIQVTSGDLRGLGYSDLVLAVPPQVCVILNQGNGTFAAPNCFGNIPGLAGITLANLNDKNIPDIIAIGSQTFVYFPGNGDGTFQAAVSQSGPYSLVGNLSGPVVGNFSPQGLSDNNGVGVMLAGANCGSQTSNYSYTIQPADSTSMQIVFQTGIIQYEGSQIGPGVNNGLDSFPGCGGILEGVLQTEGLQAQAVIRNPGNDYLYTEPLVNCQPSGPSGPSSHCPIQGFSSYFTGSNPYALCEDSYASVVNHDYDTADDNDIISYLPNGYFCIQSWPAKPPIASGQFTVPPSEILLQVLPIILSDGTTALAGLTNEIQFFYGTDYSHLNGSGMFSPSLSNPTLMQADVFLPGDPGQDLVVLDQSALKVFTRDSSSTVPVITTQPQPQTVTIGQAAVFSVMATGIPAPQFLWLENGVPAIPSGTNTSYSKTTSPSDSGAMFTVQVSNANGQIDSAPALLTLNLPPSIQTQPQSQTISFGSTVTFSVSADSQSPGAGTLTYQWSNGSSIAGATSASYTFTPKLSDSGSTFTVTVTDVFGSTVSSSATLIVTEAPVIQIQPAPQTVLLGSTFTLSVVAVGSAPLKYQWAQDNVAIPQATSANLVLSAQASDNGAAFTCAISNAYGIVTSSSALITVLFPPVITSQPASQTVLLGNPASFVVSATGTNLSYQWQRSGMNIPNATGSAYTTAPTVIGDNAATLDVVISSPYFPSATSNIVLLTVDIAPILQSQSPANPLVQTALGQTVSFQVVMQGTAPLSFEWFKNNSVIPSATSSTYTTAPLQSSDLSDTFFCVVTNAFGKVQTQTWTLNLVLIPTIFFSEPSVSAVLESALTISAVGYVAPVGTTVTWSWAANGVAIPNATATVTTSASNNGYITAAVAFAAVQQNQNGVVYTATFTDAAGSVTSPGTTLTVTGSAPPPPPEYTLALTPASQTVSAGSTATFTLAVTANNSSPVSFTCSDPIPNSTCSFSPAVVDGSAQIVMSVTTGTSAFVILGWIAFILVGFTLLFTHPKFKRVKLVYASLFLAGCAGGNSTVTTPPPPTAKTYTITVTGLQNAMQQTATATLTVN